MKQTLYSELLRDLRFDPVVAAERWRCCVQVIRDLTQLGRERRQKRYNTIQYNTIDLITEYNNFTW